MRDSITGRCLPPPPPHARADGAGSAHGPRGRRAAGRRRRPLHTLALTALALTGCGDPPPSGPDTLDPPEAATVEVTSPVGDMLAVDRSAQFTAVARDDAGEVVSGATFAWSSSVPSVASVDGTGLVSGLEAGSVLIQAGADGAMGGFDLEVVAIDSDGIAARLDDPFTGQLAAGLTADTRVLVDGARADCAQALDAGHVRDLRACLDRLATESSADPTDRALLAVLQLIAEHAGIGVPAPSPSSETAS